MGRNGAGLGGSRSEFLPESFEENNIKYERNGGCFVSTGKAVVYVISSLLLAAAVGTIVYYVIPCINKDSKNALLEDLDIESLKDLEPKLPGNIDDENSKLKQDIRPLYYRLRMQPYLDESAPNKFTVDGHVTIVLQNYDSPTSSIILNMKNLTVLQNDIKLSHSSSPRVQELHAESLVQENATDNATDMQNNIDDNFNATDNATDPLVGNATDTPRLNETTTQTPAQSVTSTSPPSSTTPQSGKPAVPTPTAETTTNGPVSSAPPTSPTFIQVASKTTIKIIGHEYDEKFEKFTINLEQPLEMGVNYTLEIPFKGLLLQGRQGFIRAGDGKSSWIATTLFKPNSARTAFPCFDDPSIKAKFEISIARKTNMTALSNMPLKDTNPLDNMPGWVWDHFQITPPMSAYLVSMTVSNFVPVVAPSNVLGTVINIWGRKEVVQKASYPLENAPKLMKYYNEYFGFNYPLAKIDLVAIPHLPVDSAESWGVIYFRERNVLVDKESSVNEKETLMKTLAQKLSTQWLGNLVTMNNWNSIWVTEGLSDFMKYAVINQTENSWEIINDLILNIQTVLEAEESNYTSHPSVNNAHDESYILTTKSTCMIRMLHHSIKENQFADGIKSFINHWKYNVSKPNDIWDEFMKNDTKLHGEITLNKFLNTWSDQEGYPLITVHRDYEKKSASIKQSPMSKAGQNSWILPLHYITGDESDKFVWLNNDTKPLTIDSVSENWILFNADRISLCRVNYDESNWRRLISVFQNETESLTPINRAMLLDDSFHLAKHGFLNYEIPLEMTKYLISKETHYLPWITALNNLDYLGDILSRTPFYGQFQDYLLKLIKNIYAKLNTEVLEDDSNLNIKLRSLIIQWACKLNYIPCKDWAFTKYKTWANFSKPDEINAVDKSLRGTMYCVALQMRGKEAFDFLWSRLLVANNTMDEASSLIFGLGCAPDTWILMRYLQRTLNNSQVSPHNAIRIWNSFSSDNAVVIAFDFLRDNWSDVKRNYDKFVLRSILRSLLPKLSTKNHIEEIKMFFQKNKSDLKMFSRDIVEIVMKIEMKLRWNKNYVNTVKKWLNSQI